MTRFLSREWIDAFNAALAAAALPPPGDGTGLAAADGPVTVAEEVRGGPDGDIRLLLHVDGGTLRLERSDGPDGGADEAAGGVEPRPDVTVALAYEDAVALSAGGLSPAEALNQGRIRVRGDLTVLVAAHRLMVAARSATADLAGSTTY